ncbi:NAD-dependent protein deacetylase SRT1 [Fusarium oxysporum f. sp. albedinis]|nr:NAD-dependent protein deacetylase SRT1 [Fusarium oxysporum f. sp. albedinis]
MPRLLRTRSKTYRRVKETVLFSPKDFYFSPKDFYSVRRTFISVRRTFISVRRTFITTITSYHDNLN